MAKNKIGRNDLCPCGSGKKYKKCCLGKEEFSTDSKKDELDSIMESEPFQQILEKIKKEGEETDERFNNLSPEEQDEIEGFWEDFYILLEDENNPVFAKKRMEEFLKQYPHLDIFIGIEDQTVFDLQDAFLRYDDKHYDEFIEFLIWLREKHSDMYKESFSFFDKYLITYFLVQKRDEEILKYFDLFKKHPDEDPDNLYKIIELFLCANKDSLLENLLSDIYVKIYKSKNVLESEEFIRPLVTCKISKYFKPDWTDKDIDMLIKEVVAFKKKLPTYEIESDKETWKQLLSYSFGSFPGIDIPDNKNGYVSYFIKLFNHYTGYLNQKKHLSWVSAEQLSDLIMTYLNTYFSRKMKSTGRAIFKFDKKTMEKHFQEYFIDFISQNAVMIFGFLQSVVFFAEYLHFNNQISSTEKDNIEQNCKSIFKSIFEEHYDQEYEIRYFESFPNF